MRSATPAAVAASARLAPAAVASAAMRFFGVRSAAASVGESESSIRRAWRETAAFVYHSAVSSPQRRSELRTPRRGQRPAPGGQGSTVGTPVQAFRPPAAIVSGSHPCRWQRRRGCEFAPGRNLAPGMCSFRSGGRPVHRQAVPPDPPPSVGVGVVRMSNPWFHWLNRVLCGRLAP